MKRQFCMLVLALTSLIAFGTIAAPGSHRGPLRSGWILPKPSMIRLATPGRCRIA